MFVKYLHENKETRLQYAKKGQEKANEMFDDVKQFEKLQNILEELWK